MKCRNCKSDIPDELHFTFCGYCGERLIREKKKKDEIKIPTPRKRGNKWYVDLRREGVTVIEDTEAEAITKAKAIRAGFVPVDKKPQTLTVDKAIDNYLNSKDNIISPSTLKAYTSVKNNAFPSLCGEDIYSIKDWQKVINGEAKRVSAKTLKNEWGLMSAVLDKCGIKHDDVALPPVVPKEMPWLDFNQIEVFVKAIRGEKCELAALLALHSLRRSELIALTPRDIYDGMIHIRGSVVASKDGGFVRKSTNKTKKSRRNVPIMIPRLAELISSLDIPDDKPLLPEHPGTHSDRIHRVCLKNGLPNVGLHGLRHSFASLAYHLRWSERQTMLIGGWSDPKIVHEIYIRLSEVDKNADIETMRSFYLPLS